MQKEKTIQFWDDFYRTEQENAVDKDTAAVKEWIVQPSDSLFECIIQELFGRSSNLTSTNIGKEDNDDEFQDIINTYKVLEIGCGTSLLSDAMCKYWEHHVQDNQKHLHIVATDVSSVCIEQQKKLQDQQLLNGNSSHTTILEYKVLNITESHPELISQYDMILDKGCLDTCLFRSKNTNDWIDIVLQNLHSWLKPLHGVYVIITPRSKIKHVRDYSGFNVTRTTLTASQFHHGDLEPRSGSCTTNNENKYTGSSKEERQYMYTCRQKINYELMECKHNSNLHCSDDLSLSDEIVSCCSTCGTTYSTFCTMKGSKVCATDTKYWNRRWRGHLQHCKVVKNNVISHNH